jgi:hypothetical protein
MENGRCPAMSEQSARKPILAAPVALELRGDSRDWEKALGQSLRPATANPSR